MTLRQQRIAKGLCPECGAEAAPYYLCGRCQFRRKLVRWFKKAEAAGGLESERQGGRLLWRMMDHEVCKALDIREAQDGDRRLLPKVRGVPVDVEREVLRILERAGAKGMSVEDVYVAWGRMRLRSARTSAAADLAYMVEAGQKREAKMARRAERARRQMAAEARRLHRGAPA